MDEMEIKKAIEFDKGLKKFVGYVSPELLATEQDKGAIASKVLVFVVKGMTIKWKQTVAYFFVGPSIDCQKLWECILELITRLHQEGLHVRGISSDMGPSNQALWRLLGIHAVPGSKRNGIDHPLIPGEKLFFNADIAHLLKNWWATLTTQNIYLPAVVGEDHPEWNGHLTVSIQHIATLVGLQEEPLDRGIALQHKLRNYHVNPGHLQKMKVRYAAEVFSRSTATALRFCVESEAIPEIGPEALPTAWFLNQVNDWFDIMNDRKYGMNDGYNGDGKVATLEDFLALIGSLTFQCPAWKPIQRGVIISTSSVIDLHSTLVKNGRFGYFLPGRLSTDCLENLFSQVRQVGSSHPGATEVRTALRLISVSQFFYVPRSSNYEDEDDNTYILEFLQTRRREQPNAELIEEDDFAEPQDLTHLQEQGLYKTAGWVAHKISSACEPCIQAITSEEPLEDCPFEWTTMLSRGGLTHPSLALYQTVKVAEVVFNSLKDTLLHCTAPITTLTEQIQEHIDPELYQVLRPDCGHDLVPDILRKFINLRVHILADDRTRRIPQAIAHAGRACYMATAANRR